MHKSLLYTQSHDTDHHHCRFCDSSAPLYHQAHFCGCNALVHKQCLEHWISTHTPMCSDGCSPSWVECSWCQQPIHYQLLRKKKLLPWWQIKQNIQSQHPLIWIYCMFMFCLFMFGFVGQQYVLLCDMLFINAVMYMAAIVIVQILVATMVGFNLNEVIYGDEVYVNCLHKNHQHGSKSEQKQWHIHRLGSYL